MAGAEEISNATPEAGGGSSAVRGRGFSLLQVVRHRLSPKNDTRIILIKLKLNASASIVTAPIFQAHFPMI